MTLKTIIVLFSSLSFYAYVVSFFVSPHMKKEFKRFNLEKLGLLTVTFQFLGATGLLLGLKYSPLLPLSSLGLSLLMLCGLIVRIRIKDSVWVSLPAVFFMVLNLLIFWLAIK